MLRLCFSIITKMDTMEENFMLMKSYDGEIWFFFFLDWWVKTGFDFF